MVSRTHGLLAADGNIHKFRTDTGASDVTWALRTRSNMPLLPRLQTREFLFSANHSGLNGAAHEVLAARRQPATSFGVGEATAGLRKGSEFLFNIDSGKAWDQFQELFKTPAVLAKYDKDFEYWVAEATDANNDLLRAKELLQQALQDQAPQIEEDQTVIDQD